MATVTQKVELLTYGKAREFYIALKELTLDGVPKDKMGAFLLLTAGLTNVVEDLDAQLNAIQSKRPKELELMEKDIDKLKDEDAQLRYSIAKSNWDTSLNNSIKTLFAVETKVTVKECALLNKDEFETFIDVHRKRLTVQNSVTLFNYLKKK